jgi:predicted methyltransferase
MKHPRILPAFSGAILMLLLVAASSGAAEGTPADSALSAAVANSWRPAAQVARDRARHPVQELAFFGLAPDESVLEIWPGGGYWTNILGPYLAPHGHYYVALPAPTGKENADDIAQFRALIASHPERYGDVQQTTLDVGHYDIAPAGSLDRVLTFRNLHNWMMAGNAQQVLAACFRALKPGGVLGIEDHRARTDQPQDPQAQNGYVREDYAIALAKKAGFELLATSEIDANPRDTKNWPGGVWTLPPTLSQGQKDRARYLAIGEADNFVLKFRKPR